MKYLLMNFLILMLASFTTQAQSHKTQDHNPIESESSEESKEIVLKSINMRIAKIQETEKAIAQLEDKITTDPSYSFDEQKNMYRFVIASEVFSMAIGSIYMLRAEKYVNLSDKTWSLKNMIKYDRKANVNLATGFVLLGTGALALYVSTVLENDTKDLILEFTEPEYAKLCKNLEEKKIKLENQRESLKIVKELLN